jgi:hypothetical protein
MIKVLMDTFLPAINSRAGTEGALKAHRFSGTAEACGSDDGMTKSNSRPVTVDYN